VKTPDPPLTGDPSEAPAAGQADGGAAPDSARRLSQACFSPRRPAVAGAASSGRTVSSRRRANSGACGYRIYTESEYMRLLESPAGFGESEQAPAPLQVPANHVYRRARIRALWSVLLPRASLGAATLIGCGLGVAATLLVIDGHAAGRGGRSLLSRTVAAVSTDAPGRRPPPIHARVAESERRRRLPRGTRASRPTAAAAARSPRVTQTAASPATGAGSAPVGLRAGRQVSARASSVAPIHPPGLPPHVGQVSQTAVEFSFER
jgi:hypothetical protein